MPSNLPSPEEIARVRAKVAGRPESWENYLPDEHENPNMDDLLELPNQKQTKNPTQKTSTSFTKTNSAVEDAKRLYSVSEAIYKTLIFFNYVVGIVGGISAMVCFIAAANLHETALGLAGLATIAATIVLCFINYAAAVLTTHFGKVLSNISISLLNK